MKTSDSTAAIAPAVCAGEPEEEGDMSRELTLAEKLVEVAKELDAISKDKQHPHYKYVSAEAFITAVRVPLMSQGIIIVPSTFRAEWLPQDSPNGKPGVAAHLHAGYTITDGEESIEASVVGEGWDGGGDKAVYKAMTGAHKYLLRILFNIPMKDDPEGSGGGYGGTQGQGSQSSPPPSGGTHAGGSTTKQQKCIYAKAKGLYPEDFDVFKSWLRRQFGTDHTGDLTMEQAKEVIDTLVEQEEAKS